MSLDDWADASDNSSRCYGVAIDALRERLERSKVEIGPHVLYCEDAEFILPTLGRFDACVTDPPYGLDLGVNSDKRQGHGLGRDGYASYQDTLDNFLGVVVPVLRASLGISERGAVFCNHNLHALPKPDAIGGVYIPAAVGRHCWGFNSFAPIAYYGKAPGLQNGSRPSAILSNEMARPNGHPCPKPLGWMKWLLSHASIQGETILDPFMGSGTTGVACVRMGRIFTGIERELKYFDIACRRIEEAMKQQDLFIPQPKPEKPIQEALTL